LDFTIQGLKGNGTTHGDKVAHIVQVISRDMGIGKRSLVIEDAHSSSHLGNLVIVQESHDQVGNREALAIRTGTSLAGTLTEQSHQAVEERQEKDGDGPISTRAHAVVVAQILRVGIVAQLVGGEYVAPGAKITGDLTLISTQVGEEEDVGLVESQIAADQ
jgi:hypothetical protein